MLLPKEPSLVDSELGIAIAEGKVAGEHQWIRQGKRVDIMFNGDIFLKIDEAADVSNMAGRVLGRAVPLPLKKK